MIMRRVVILGSTGSIGTTCLNYLRKNNPGFIVVGLTAHKNVEKLTLLGKEFNCPTLITDPIEDSGLEEFFEATHPDIVLNAIAGADGLFATVTAINSGIDIALSNKESVVMGGTWIFKEADKRNVRIIPVDSEHSAIYNLLKGHKASSLVITASGGPFVDRIDLDNVTVEEALNHPTWKMGKKITIDSSTLANKGLEVIEASFLFGFKPEDIEVTVHRQSVVHSMVRTKEGAVYAQMSPPDMTLPIISALSDGKIELEDVVSPLSFTNLKLTFEKPDTLRFPLLDLAYKALMVDGSATIAYNAADEVAVNAFMEGIIPYSKISEIVKKTIEDPIFKEKVSTYEETMEKDRIARIIARNAL